jgi:TonB family protein
MEKGNHVARNNSDNSLQFQRSKATAFPSQGNAWLPCLSGSKIPHMRRYVLFLAILFAALTTLRCAVVEESFAQAAAGPGAAQSGVVLVKLFGPVYPPIARTAGIKGEVVLALGIRRDGSVESANVVSGPLLLRQAALDSAQQSQFECRGCGESATSYSLSYTFRLVDVGCCATKEELAKIARDYGQLPHVMQSQNQITLIAESGCYCESIGITKVRAAKCLYFWRCGVRPDVGAAE